MLLNWITYLFISLTLWSTWNLIQTQNLLLVLCYVISAVGGIAAVVFINSFDFLAVFLLIIYMGGILIFVLFILLFLRTSQQLTTPVISVLKDYRLWLLSCLMLSYFLQDLSSLRPYIAQQELVFHTFELVWLTTQSLAVKIWPLFLQHYYELMYYTESYLQYLLGLLSGIGNAQAWLYSVCAGIKALIHTAQLAYTALGSVALYGFLFLWQSVTQNYFNYFTYNLQHLVMWLNKPRISRYFIINQYDWGGFQWARYCVSFVINCIHHYLTFIYLREDVSWLMNRSVWVWRVSLKDYTRALSAPQTTQVTFVSCSDGTCPRPSKPKLTGIKLLISFNPTQTSWLESNYPRFALSYLKKAAIYRQNYSWLSSYVEQLFLTDPNLQKLNPQKVAFYKAQLIKTALYPALKLQPYVPLIKLKQLNSLLNNLVLYKTLFSNLIWKLSSSIRVTDLVLNTGMKVSGTFNNLINYQLSSPRFVAKQRRILQVSGIDVINLRTTTKLVQVSNAFLPKQITHAGSNPRPYKPIHAPIMSHRFIPNVNPLISVKPLGQNTLVFVNRVMVYSAALVRSETYVILPKVSPQFQSDYWFSKLCLELPKLWCNRWGFILHNSTKYNQSTGFKTTKALEIYREVVRETYDKLQIYNSKLFSYFQTKNQYTGFYYFEYSIQKLGYYMLNNDRRRLLFWNNYRLTLSTLVQNLNLHIINYKNLAYFILGYPAITTVQAGLSISYLHLLSLLYFTKFTEILLTIGLGLVLGIIGIIYYLKA